MFNIIKHIHGFRVNVYTAKLVNLFALILVPVFLIFLPMNSFAELKAMTGCELKTTTAQAGFTNFTMDKNTARLFLDIHIETYTTIENFSAGWYSKTGSTGWDQKWDTVKLGASATEPLVIDGLVLIADFDDTTKTDPILERIVIGSNRLQGTLSANFASFSGIYSSALTGGGGSPDVVLDRSSVLSGSTTNFVFDSNASSTSDRGLFFVLNLNPSNIGIQVVAGYDEKSIPLTGTGTPWWDSP